MNPLLYTKEDLIKIIGDLEQNIGDKYKEIKLLESKIEVQKDKMPAIKTKALYTIHEFAELISVPLHQLLYWLNCRLIKTVSLKEHERIPYTELERIVQEGI